MVSRLTAVRFGAGSGLFLANLKPHLEVQCSLRANLNLNLKVWVRRFRFRRFGFGFEPGCTGFTAEM